MAQVRRAQETQEQRGQKKDKTREAQHGQRGNQAQDFLAGFRVAETVEADAHAQAQEIPDGGQDAPGGLRGAHFRISAMAASLSTQAQVQAKHAY